VAWALGLVLAGLGGIAHLQLAFGRRPPLRQVAAVLSGEPVAGETEGRVNLLFLGIPGRRHHGARLIDTIILISLFPDLRRATVVSIPRDLAVSFPDGELLRVNEAYRFKDENGARGGAVATRILGDVFGVPIHYYAVIDIEGLEDIVDAAGGVWIWVDRPFVDPVFRHGRERGLSFDAGLSWMDGERALQYARSRHGTNREGTDFARSQRQQKLLFALRERILSVRVVMNPVAVWRLVQRASAAIDTNMEPWEMAALLRLVPDLSVESMPPTVLGDVVEAWTSPQGAAVLRPLTGGLEPIRHRIRDILAKPALADLQAALATRCSETLPDFAHGAPVVVPRWAWDHSSPRSDTPQRQQIGGILIHHDAIRYGDDLTGEDKLARLARSLRNEYGWEDLPYHYLVDVDGRVFEGAPEWAVTRTRTWHDPSGLLHLALLGNYSVDRPTSAQVTSLLQLVHWKAREHGVPASRIHLHGELVATECPGRHLRERLLRKPWCSPPALAGGLTAGVD
jgi:LCP family protein required for cell wall assembly